MKLFKVTQETKGISKRKYAFAKQGKEAIDAVKIMSPDLENSPLEAVQLCEAHEIIPVTNKRLVFSFGNFEPNIHPIHQGEFATHLTLEMNRLNEEIEGIQAQKAHFLVGLCKAQGMMDLAKKIEEMGLPKLISIKESEFKRLSYLEGITRVERAHEGMFDGENNVRMFWDDPKHPVKAKFISIKL